MAKYLLAVMLGRAERHDDDDHVTHTHDGRGVVSMANKGLNTNRSQFFITYGSQPAGFDLRIGSGGDDGTVTPLCGGQFPTTANCVLKCHSLMLLMNWLSHQPLNCSFCRFPLYCLLLSLLVTPYVSDFPDSPCE
jgi:hypothetical protein